MKILEKVNTKLLNGLLYVLGIMLVIWIVWGKMFPEDIPIKPVVEETSTTERDAKRTTKGVIKHEEIDVIKPIDSIPVIRLQSDRQRTDESTDKLNESSESKYNFDKGVERFPEEIESEPSYTEQEREYIKRSSSYSPIECYNEDGTSLTTGCSELNIYEEENK